MRGLDSTVGAVALGAAALAIITLLLCAWMALRIRRLRADQVVVLGTERRDLVAHSAGLERTVEELAGELAELAERLGTRLDVAEERLDSSVSRTAVLRYDALNESTGRQSSSIALLDDHGNGVVVSSILQREQARVYAKPVIGGRSRLELSPEERQAIATADRAGGSTEAAEA